MKSICCNKALASAGIGSNAACIEVLPSVISLFFCYRCLERSDNKCTVPSSPKPVGPGCASGLECLKWRHNLGQGFEAGDEYSCCSDGSDGTIDGFCSGSTLYPPTGNAYSDPNCTYKSVLSTSSPPLRPTQTPPPLPPPPTPPTPPTKSAPPAVSQTVATVILWAMLVAFSSQAFTQL